MRPVPRYLTVLIGSTVALACGLAPVGSLGQSAAASKPDAAPLVMPDTAAGRQLGAWLEAFNGGDTAQLAAIRAAFAPGVTAPPPEAVEAMRQRSGGFDLRKIEESSERLGCSVSTITRNWRYAKLWLRDRLGPGASTYSGTVRIFCR